MNQKGFANIVLVVVVIILAGVAGYFALVLVKKSEPKICTEEAKVCPDGTTVGRVPPMCEFTACPTVTSILKDETSDWKIYRNEEYGFEVKYPANFPIRTGRGGEIFTLQVNAAPIPAADMGGPAKYLRIGAEPVRSLFKCPQTPAETVNISGVATPKCLIPDSYFSPGTGLLLQINYRGYSYFFNADLYDVNQVTVDKILSTFKFIK